MRIIAGKAKGRKLLAPLNGGRETKVGDPHATRPTLDRVKEAMFSIINHKILDSVVLDLFAGTGSLGLESISRGASHATFVDYYRETYDLLNENIKNLKFNDQSQTLFMDYKLALNKFKNDKKVFDIIFIDPPYLNNMIPDVVKFIQENGLLSKNGVIVTKTDISEEMTEGYQDIELVLSRKYGRTVLGFYQYKDEDEENDRE